MNAFFPPWHFGGLGSAFLLPADIEAIQALYGAGARGRIRWAALAQEMEKGDAAACACTFSLGSGLPVGGDPDGGG